MKLRKTLLVVLTLALMVCLSLSTVFSAAANDKIVFNPSEVESSTEIKESYSLNQEITFPSSVTIAYKGSNYEAKDGLIYYPSGACYDLNSHVLDEKGIYTLEYFFEAEGGVKVTATTTFKVNTTYYNFTLDDGSTTKGYAEPGTGTQDHVNDLYTTKIGGLKVDIKEGNTFNLNVPIDLRKVNNTTYNSTNIVQYSVIGGSYVDSELPEFLQNGADMYSFGSLDDQGKLVEDATALVTNFYAGTTSTDPIIKFRNGVTDPGIVIQVYAYNKAKEFVGVFTDADGNKDFTLASNWATSTVAKTSSVTGLAYMRMVVKFTDGRNVSDIDKANVANGLIVYRTIFNSNAGTAVMRFTDAYDPSIYVEVLIDTSGTTFWQRARTNHQEDRGFRVTTTNETSNSRTLCFVDGQKFIAYKGQYGKVSNNYTQTKTRYGERISFNMENNRLYSEMMSGLTTATAANHLLNDFNNDAVYEGNHFQGFTTGEVFVSFYFESYVRTSSQIVIHALGEYDLEDILSWEGKTYEDVDAPTFVTEFENTDQFGVYGSVGDFVKIPEVKAWDINAVGDMAVNVYRNYNSDQKVKVNVVDGGFTIGSPDTYTIEYLQKDSNGNVGIYTINVIGKSAGEGDSISIATTNIESLSAGQEVVLPAYTFTTLNRADLIDLKITASCGKETINVDLDKMSFVPMYSGTYTITYEFNDNIGNNVYSYTVESVANDSSVVYKEVPQLPRYFIKGQKYNISQAFAYKFETGAPVAEDADMYIVFDKGDRTLITNPSVTEITGNDEACLVYELDGVTYTTQSIPIIDVTYYKSGAASGIDMYKFFDGNFTYNPYKIDDPTKREGNIVYYAEEGASDMNMSFINSVDYNFFGFKYQVREEYSNFNKLSLKVFGVQNPEQQLLVELVRSGAGTEEEVISLYIDGAFIVNLSDYKWADTKTKNIAYNKGSNTLTVGSSTFIYPIEFDGMLVDFDVSISDITGVAGMMVTNVCNQKLSGTVYNDAVAPSVSIVTSQGEYAIGDEVTLNLPVYSDVLTQIDPSSLAFTVTDPDGAPVTSKEGVLLNGKANAGQGVQYSIVFDKITTYHVKYTGKDYAGASVSYTYLINVIDVEEPVVKLISVEEGKTYKVNKWANFEFTYEATDNVSQTANITVSVVLYDLDSGVWRNNVGISFKCFYAGNFRVQVLAQDEAGNFSSVSFFLTAE